MDRLLLDVLGPVGAAAIERAVVARPGLTAAVRPRVALAWAGLALARGYRGAMPGSPDVRLEVLKHEGWAFDAPGLHGLGGPLPECLAAHVVALTGEPVARVPRDRAMVRLGRSLDALAKVEFDRVNPVMRLMRGRLAKAKGVEAPGAAAAARPPVAPAAPQAPAAPHQGATTVAAPKAPAAPIAPGGRPAKPPAAPKVPALKAEGAPAAKPRFKAAMRHRDTNDIVVTGAFHDLNQIPRPWRGHESKIEMGFVDPEGRFYDRTAAAQAAGKITQARGLRSPGLHADDLEGDHRSSGNVFRAVKAEDLRPPRGMSLERAEAEAPCAACDRPQVTAEGLTGCPCWSDVLSKAEAVRTPIGYMIRFQDPAEGVAFIASVRHAG